MKPIIWILLSVFCFITMWKFRVLHSAFVLSFSRRRGIPPSFLIWEWDPIGVHHHHVVVITIVDMVIFCRKPLSSLRSILSWLRLSIVVPVSQVSSLLLTSSYILFNPSFSKYSEEGAWRFSVVSYLGFHLFSDDVSILQSTFLNPILILGVFDLCLTK